jgi:hypothetical protein
VGVLMGGLGRCLPGAPHQWGGGGFINGDAEGGCRGPSGVWVSGMIDVATPESGGEEISGVFAALELHSRVAGASWKAGLALLGCCCKKNRTLWPCPGVLSGFPLFCNESSFICAK